MKCCAIVVAVGPVAAGAVVQGPPVSTWVHPGPMASWRTPARDSIMDFSPAGYMGGGVALPAVPVKLTVRPSGADDTAAIQAAIDKVSAMEPVDGFRVAVLLGPPAREPSRGLVLRGSGNGASGTTIKMTGGKHAAFAVSESRVRWPSLCIINGSHLAVGNPNHYISPPPRFPASGCTTASVNATAMAASTASRPFRSYLEAGLRSERIGAR